MNEKISKRINVRNEGFTLIELLVVIAIIALLASIVLVSLNSARTRSKDARILADVQQIRVDAESAFNGTDYTAALIANTLTWDGSTNCSGIVNMGNRALLCTDALNNNGKVAVVTNANAKTYTVLGLLSSGKYICVDSRGKTDISTSTLPVSGTPECN
jgi:prepilin-type N-terminal cleavage/methylation domain-containing protein